MTHKIKELNYEFKVKDQAEDDDYFFFEGYGSTFGNIDLMDDIIERGAFTESLARNPKPKMLFSHDRAKPIGVFDEVYEDPIGLFVKGRILKSVSYAKDVGELLKIGAIDSMSVGIRVQEYTYDTDAEICHITKADLFEISIVSMPANIKAIVTRVKEDDKELLTKKISIELAKEIKNKRDFENILRDSKVFTKSAATYLASRFLELTQSESVGNDKNTDTLLDLASLVKQVKEIRTL